MPAQKDLDDAHGGTTAPANECWHAGGGLLVHGRFRRWRIEQVPSLGQVPAPIGIGEQAVVTNAVEAAGQHV